MARENCIVLHFQDKITMFLYFIHEQLMLYFDLCCLTFKSGVFVHPVPDDGPQQQHGAGHHQAVHGREQQAVPVQLHQEHGHSKVPHSVALGSQILII